MSFRTRFPIRSSLLSPSRLLIPVIAAAIWGAPLYAQSPAPAGGQGNTDNASPPPGAQGVQASPHTPAAPTDRHVMNECITRAQADNQGMTKAEARKACKEQLKLGKPPAPGS